MKQTERRMGTDISIECKLTLKEKLTVDLSVDSNYGILESEYNILTFSD